MMSSGNNVNREQSEYFRVDDESIKYNEETRVYTQFLNVTVIICSIVAAGLLFLYPVGHFLGEEIEQKSKSQGSTINISNVDCTLSVTNESGSLISDYFKETDDHVMGFAINFDNQSQVNTSTTNDVILPLRWIWIYGNGLDYLKWPQEYFIWSFGLLDFDTIAHIPLTLTVSPPRCMLDYGDRNTTFKVANALNNKVKTLLDPKKKHYKYSKWCYSKIVEDMDPGFIVLNFGYFLGEIGYVCCHISENNQVTCSDTGFKPTFLINWLPFIVSFCLLLLSPLLFSCIKDWLWPSNITVLYQKNESDHWVFFQKKSPITFLSIIASLLRKFCCCCCPSSCCSNICNLVLEIGMSVLILLCFPVVIYIKLLLLYNLIPIYKLLSDKMQHNHPVEFYSMLFRTKSRLENFLPVTHGPCIMILIFIIVGIIVIILEKLPFCSQKIRDMAANLFCLKDVAFDSLSSTIKNKCLEMFSDSSETCNCICRCYYIPLMFAFRLILARIICFISGVFKGLNKCLIALAYPCVVLAGVAWIYFFFAYCSIFISSFEFLISLGSILYLAVVKYPEVIGGYVSLSFGVAIIIVSSLRYPARRYLRFLYLTIKILKTIDYNVDIAYTIKDKTLNLTYFDPNQITNYSFNYVEKEEESKCILTKNTLVLFLNTEKITSFCINGINVKLSENTTPAPTPHIKYQNGQLGVNKDLFLTLVKTLRPIKLTLALVCLQIIVSIALFVWTMWLIHKLDQTSHITIISNIVMAYVIVKIPELIRLLGNDFHAEAKTLILEEKIRYEVLKPHEEDCEESTTNV